MGIFCALHCTCADMVEKLSALEPRQWFFILVASGALVKNMHLYRKLRPLAIPAMGGLVVYRAYNGNTGDNFAKQFLEFSQVDHHNIDEILGDIFGLILFVALVNFIYRLLDTDVSNIQKDIMAWGYNVVKDTSFVKDMLKKEQDKIEIEFEADLKGKSRAIGNMNKTLPKSGTTGTQLLKLMKGAKKTEDISWESGKVSGAVYHGITDHRNLLNKAFAEYSITNPLHADIWPSVMKFESEIVSMTANLVCADKRDEVCGCTTSGGTESIILAIKAHRDYWRDNFGITQPHLVCGESAHAAVDKACDLMNIKLTKVGLDASFRVDVAAMERAIGPNTIMLYASAPSFPHGSIDPIRDIGQLAVKYNVGLHVDCCLGGFVLPFAKKLCYKIPDFDFGVPGVSTMSLDTHKYGYALKGTSVVLYRNKELRHSQYFCYADWTGGMYTTPTIAGSRSGGLISQCWASLMALGEEGYMQHTQDIMETVKIVADGTAKIPGLEILGESEAMIVCFTTTKSSGMNVYNIGDKMSKKGWNLNALQSPPCLHLCCTVAHHGKEQVFLDDLAECTAAVMADPGATGGKAAIYGLTASLPAGPVNEMMKIYNDVVLKV